MILQKRTVLLTKKRVFQCKDVRTTPGQSQNIREIIARITRGQYVDMQATNYSLSESFNEYSRLDKVDKLQFARDNKTKVETLRNALKSQAEQQKKPVDEAPSLEQQPPI